MRRVITTALVALVLALPVASWTGRALASTDATAKKKVATRKVVGTAIETERWGPVQVTIVVRKTTITTDTKKKVTRKITAVSATYPAESPRSMLLNSNAIPILKAEALKAQSANIDLVSGATGTSEAFVESLQSAIVAMKKV
jgi:uncharacterized protein with FMN-binding domain